MPEQKFRDRRLRQEMNALQREWLHEADSLTEKINQQYHDDFRVRQLSSSSEIVHRCGYFTRSVLLSGGEQLLVYAETRGSLQRLGYRKLRLNLLGERSIGTYIISRDQLPRRFLKVKKLTSTHPMYRKAQHFFVGSPGFLWAREAEYCWHRSRLNITEVFLPSSGLY